MSFPRYPKYKPSGVEWLGDVPEHWKLRPLRSIGIAYGGLTGKTAEAFTDEGPNTYYYIPFTNILNNTVVQASRLDPVQIAPGDAQNEVHPGDLLFLMSSEDYEFLGFSAVVRDVPPRTFLNSFCKGFRPYTSGGCAEYLNYYCRSRVGRALISQLGFGFTRINLRTGALLSTPVLDPPLPEQRAIAAFLDRETAKIDGLVAEQQRLIELLKEKRQAAISHSVTKGLDPTVPMKPSGVEWLGDVPVHWEIVPLRHIADCLDGLRVPLNGEQRAARPGAVPYWGANCVVDHVDTALLSEPVVLLGEDGAPFFDRSKSVAFYIDEPIWPNNHVHVLRPRGVLDGKHLAAVLNVTEYARFIDGSTRDKLTQTAMNAIPISIPPLPEQRAIAAFLDRETAKIDGLVADAESAITLLQERRSALISAAVTGQIDVRNAVTAEAA